MSIEIKIYGNTTDEIDQAVVYLAECFGVRPVSKQTSLDDIGLNVLVETTKARLADAGFTMSVGPSTFAGEPEAPTVESKVETTEPAPAEEEKKTRGRKPKITPEQAKETLAAAAAKAPAETSETKETPKVDKAPVSNGVDVSAPAAVDPEAIKAKCLIELQDRYLKPGGDDFVKSILAKYGAGEERLTKVRAENFVEIEKVLWPA